VPALAKRINNAVNGASNFGDHFSDRAFMLP
jgi:hypothetical protein